MSGLSEETIAQLREAFDMVDKDGSGQLSAREIFKLMKGIGNKMPMNEVQALIDEIDTSGNGELNFEEFCHLVKKVQDKKEGREEEPVLRSRPKRKDEEEEPNDEEAEEDRVIKAFMTFDKNKKGKIKVAEFRYILEQLGYKYDTKFVDELFNEAELDENGEMVYGEAHIMCNLFNIEALERASSKELKYHIAKKKMNYIRNTIIFLIIEKKFFYRKLIW